MEQARIVFSGKTARGLDILLRYPMHQDLHALWAFINALSQERTFILFQGQTIAWEDERRYLSQVLDQITQRRTVQILAFHGDDLVGNTDISLLDGVSAHVGGLGIAVAQSYRGQGVGELLMRAVYDEAVAQLPGLRMVILDVFGNNTVGLNLYRKLGYVEYARLPGGVLHRDQYVDRVSMVKVVST